jgi:hypothetical protein
MRSEVTVKPGQRYDGKHGATRIVMPLSLPGRENSAAIRIYHEDHGSGSVVVLVHDYALNEYSRERKKEASCLPPGAP